MRIGIDALSLKPGRTGGGETYLVGLLEPLLASGHEFVVWGPPELEQRFARRDRVTWKPIRLPVPLRLLHEQFLLPRAIRRQRLDVMLFPGNLMSLRCPCPSLVVLHDLASFYYADEFPGELGAVRGRLLPPLVAAALRHATRIVAVSGFTRDQAVRRLGLDPARIDVIHSGVTPATGHGRTPPVAPPYILSVGTQDSHKNLERLAEAFVHLKRTASLPHRLVLAGMRGTGSARLARRLADLAHTDIFCLGRIETAALEALYRHAALFVFPSLYEGFGLPLVEAMARGVPVVASDRGALPEVAGDAALFADPLDVEALAAAMGRVLGDPELHRSLEEAGRKRAAAFSWATTAERTLAALERTAREGAR